MRIGITLPHFGALSVTKMAKAAEDTGIDGVFVFDHLWPVAQPQMPALSPFVVLGEVAATTGSIYVGSLVARIGKIPNQLLLAQFSTLNLIAPGRVIAGLGLGDELTREENRRYGIPWQNRKERLLSLGWCIEKLTNFGIPCWVGGYSSDIQQIALGHSAAINLWDLPLAELKKLEGKIEIGSPSETTWAGPIRGTASQASDTLRLLRDTGFTWCVWAWPSSIKKVAEAIEFLR
ncbi:MAG: LLM class flavin-dependent oxidoreductase [Actinobacteria bacterium]|nr:LLM class flavin-dependent oxidoreductase [Actinomycetota bacterium]MCL6105472.1 LLM class flavin-dependent oxidoreductase [Actinomycetota bacterium]